MLCSGDHALCWSGAHSRPKGNISSYEKRKSKVKLTGVSRVAKQPKIRVNHHMYDVILLDIVLQVTIFKHKDCADKIFISKGNHFIHSNGDRESWIHLSCEITSVKGNPKLNEDSMSSILSLAYDTDSCRENMDTSIDDAFCAHNSKGIARYERSKYRMRVDSGHASKKNSRIEYESMLEKEGIVKEKKIF